VGDRRRGHAQDGLSNLVRPRDGRLQRVGEGQLPRGAREPRRRADRAEPARRRDRDHARAAAAHVRRARSRPGLLVPAPSALLRSPMSKHEPIAIVGVSALFPGSIEKDGFWKDILAGTDRMTEIPESHWLIEDYYDADPSKPDKTYAKRGAFIPEVDF